MAAKKASGRNVEEWERGTYRVRVPKEPADALAKKWKIKAADAVIRAVKEAAEK